MRLLAPLGLVSVALTSACLQGVPQEQVGIGQLEFWVRGSAQGSVPLTVQIWGKPVAVPFENRTWRGREMFGTTDVTLKKLAEDEPERLMFTQYHNTDVDLSRQHEVLLFARDPEEQYRFFESYFDDTSTRWSEQTNGTFEGGSAVSRMPSVLTFVYPPAPGWTIDQRMEVGPIRRSHFFTTSATPAGPATEPHVSVRAARVVNHGFCSREEKTEQIIKRLNDEFWTTFVNKVKDASWCTDVTRNYSVSTTFLHQTPDKKVAQFGGFFFNFRYTLNVHHLIGGGFGAVKLAMAYWFRLRDGRVTIEPTLNNSFADGPQNTSTEKDLLKAALCALGTCPASAPDGMTIPRSINEEFEKQQVFAGATEGSRIDCTPRGEKDYRVEPGGECHSFVNAMQFGALAGGATYPLSAQENDVMLGTMKSTYSADGVTFYKYYQCVPRPKAGAPEPVGRCEYQVRALRLNAYPDSIELVFMDKDREVANPVFPVYLLTLAGGRRFDLCRRDPVVREAPFTATRDYSTYIRTDGFFGHLGGTFEHPCL